jgi:hypothetical protein
MSGMARLARSMPGSIATFATCWSASLSPACSSRLSVANTMPGTRMPSCGSMRHTLGLISSTPATMLTGYPPADAPRIQGAIRSRRRGQNARFYKDFILTGFSVWKRG